MGELSGEELENLVEERYRPSSSFITYAEGEYEPRRLAAESAVALYEPTRTLVAGNAMAPSSEDPTTWKVKCVVCFSHIWSLSCCNDLIFYLYDNEVFFRQAKKMIVRTNMLDGLLRLCLVNETTI